MSLPLLRFTQTLYDDVDLSDVAIIACQHLLGTTVNLFDALIEKGLRPERTFVIGKCYSTHVGTMKKLARRGVTVSPMSIAFDATRTFDDQFLSYTKEFFDDAMTAITEDEDVKKIVVLDDGGFLLQHANTLRGTAERFVGVEQTSSGFERLKNIPLRFPVVNIARSDAKLKYESPFIAADVIRRIRKNTRLRKTTRVLVVGQGAIGRECKLQLRGMCDVYGCDATVTRCDFGGAYAEQLHTFDVIIGATGTQVLSVDDCARLKPGVVLVSASSSDREFPALAFRQANPNVTDCHSEITMNGVRLLNGGFPVNFTGRRHSVAPRNIQLTRALLFAGVCEALEMSVAPGFYDLSTKQEKILAAFHG